MKDAFLLKEMRKIGEMLLGKGKDRPTVRNIIFESALVDKHTKRIIGEPEIVLKHED